LGYCSGFKSFFRLSTHYHSQYDTCNRSVNCFIDKHAFQASWDTSSLLLRHSCCIIQLFCLLGLTSVLLHSNTTAAFHLTPVIVWAFSHHNSHLRIPYIGILSTSSSTDSNHESSADSHKITFQITSMVGNISHDRSRLYDPCALCFKPNCITVLPFLSQTSIPSRSSKLFMLYYL